MNRESSGPALLSGSSKELLYSKGGFPRGRGSCGSPKADKERAVDKVCFGR